MLTCMPDYNTMLLQGEDDWEEVMKRVEHTQYFEDFQSKHELARAVIVSYTDNT